jgi:Domain of Unknown Function (DUF1080)
MLVRAGFLIFCAAAAGQTPAPWTPLFDGQALGLWKETRFTGGGVVRITEGELRLEPGQPMTGVTYAGRFPVENYELRFEGMRRRGNDFFATVTFPVGETFCTFVTGGWGGDIIGLSNIDGGNASENETRAYFNFENNRWYRFRLQVTRELIRAWIDDERVVDIALKGREVGLRPGETKLMAPLGFASYATAGSLRRIEYQPLKVKR